MVTAQREPLTKRLDGIALQMENRWKSYGFRDRQDATDYCFWVTRSSISGILGNETCVIRDVKTPEDLLKIYPVETFKESTIGRQRYKSN